MPAIPNARQEAFARLVFKGLPPYRAYPQAGYAKHHYSPYRMLRENAAVRARLAELRRQAAMRSKYTVETITDNLELAREQAYRIENPGAQVQALTAQAKLLGLIVEKTQELKPVGDMSEEELINTVSTMFGLDRSQVIALLAAKAELPEPTHKASDIQN